MPRRSRTSSGLRRRNECALLLLLCASASSSLTAHAQLRGPAQGRQAVLHGTADELATYGAVGALLTRVREVDRFVCSATLIAPTVAISAAHCLSDVRAGGLSFVLADDPSMAAADLVPVRRAVLHPDYDVDLATAAVSNDLAWVVLARAPASAQPAALGLDEVVAVGQRVQLVGFGATSLTERDLRAKNAAQARIEQISEFELVLGAGDEVQACTGDSGGPAFIVDSRGARKLVAVTSRALHAEQPCRGGSIHTRVDAHREFLMAALEADRGAAEGCTLRASNRSERGSELAFPSALLFVWLRARRRRPSAR